MTDTGFLATALQLLTHERTFDVLRALFLLFVGFFVARLLRRVPKRAMGGRAHPHQIVLAQRLVFYVVFGLFAVSALHQLGFNLGVLLGAVGILSVAIGFASQTSASNLISGLFLLGERPFSVGDIIDVGGTLGEVLSVDLLSVKLRTFDNLFVRIPNETLIKSEVKTLTRFPIRRLDMQLGVAYRENIDHVRKVLLEVADRNPLCLDEPKPTFIFLGFGDSALNIQFSVWARRENFLDLRNSMHERVKLAFDDAGIEIPFPHRSLYTGSMTEPLPIRLVTDTPPPEQGGEAQKP